MKILYQYVEKAYGETIENYNENDDADDEMHAIIRKTYISADEEGYAYFEDYNDLIAKSLTTNDKKLVQAFLEKYTLR